MKKEITLTIFVIFSIVMFSSLGMAVDCGGATVCPCGGNVTESYTMTGDLIDCNSNGLDIRVDNIIIDCNNFNISGNLSYNGIYLDEVDNISVKNCDISSFSAGLYVHVSSNITITNVTLSNNIGYGLSLTEVLGNNNITNVISKNNVLCGFVAIDSVFNLSDSLIYNNSDDGIYAGVSSPLIATIDNVSIYSNGDSGITIESIYFNIYNSLIYNNTNSGIYLGNSTLGNTKLRMNNTNITTNGQDGIYAQHMAEDSSYNLTNNRICGNLGSGEAVDSSCPFVYAWNGEDYQFVNDAFPLGKLWFLEEVPSVIQFLVKIGILPKVPGIRDTTYAKIPFDLKEVDGKYEFKIREQYDERSYFDYIELMVVDHSPDYEVYPDRYGDEIITTRKDLITPVSCVDNEGDDCLPLIKNQDNDVKKLSKNDFVIINFGDLSDAEKIKMVISKGAVGSQNVKQFEVRNKNGEWVEGDYKLGRIVNLYGFATTPNVFDMTNIFETDDFEIRIFAEDLPFYDREFDERLAIDFIAIDTSLQKKDFKIRTLSPVSATLGRGNVGGFWTETRIFDNGDYKLPTYSASRFNSPFVEDVTELLQGDECNFVNIKDCEEQVVMEFGDEFSAYFDVPELVEGMERDFIVVTNGAYEKLPSSGHTDIHITKPYNLTGSGNTCGTTWNYNDSGQSGCTYLCSDTDEDGFDDAEDKLYYNESNVSASGVTDLNITVGGNSTSGLYYTGEHEVDFYDGSDLLINFSHNFGTGNLDLSQVTIVKADNSIIVNLSGQLQGNKTIYITDNSFASLCVKDSEISSIAEISSSCGGVNETDFSSCLGGSLTSGGVVCTDLGSTIRIENLGHSAARGSASSTVEDTTSSSGGSILKVQMGNINNNDFSGKLKYGYRGEFTVKNESHRIFLNRVDRANGIAYFNVYSELQKVEVKVGEDKEVDLDGDGIMDVLLKLNSINENKMIVDLELGGIVKDVEVVDAEEVVEKGGEGIGEIVKDSNYLWVWIVFVVVAAIIGYILWKNKKAEKKIEKKRK